MRAEHVYYNNVWNAQAAGGDWQQCIVEKPGRYGPIYGWSWRWPERGTTIYAYPQVKTGSSPWDPLPRGGTDLPARVEALGSLVVSHALTVEGSAEHNVATTLWLTDTDDIGEVQNPATIVAEVMFWTYATPGHVQPAGRRVGMIEERGQRWSVWLREDWQDQSGQNENEWTYLAFVAEQASLTARFDPLTLLRRANIPTLDLDRLAVADVELGTEILRGEGTVWVEAFSVEAGGKPSHAR
ncbi:GH12 family glycosyl hydrolase domain-containing protein [Parvularcula dongshanensis]|uniref:Uncharacterized protein n=1 Tax=Parvularcula dongshanensis TaxID=1173995 RepID=A0A840I7P7_9PROT|nr:hypothetical protein [Parvularcula dongshanensis]